MYNTYITFAGKVLKSLTPMPNLADHSYLCVRNLLQDLNKNYGKDLRSKQLEKQIFS